MQAMLEAAWLTVGLLHAYLHCTKSLHSPVWTYAQEAEIVRCVRERDSASLSVAT